MAEVFSVIIWLRDSGVLPLGAVQDKVSPENIPAGHRSFVFNAPALPRAHYAHFASREEAESCLRQLGQAISGGETIYVTGEETSFAIPAHSVHYVALGQSGARKVNPDDGTQQGQQEHEARSRGERL